MFDLELDSQILHSKLVIWSIEALIVLGAMSVDLISGVNKARQRGEATTSRLLRKTISKFITYEGCLFLGLLVDLLIYLGRIFEVCHKIFDFNHLFEIQRFLYCSVVPQKLIHGPFFLLPIHRHDYSFMPMIPVNINLAVTRFSMKAKKFIIWYIFIIHR